MKSAVFVKCYALLDVTVEHEAHKALSYVAFEPWPFTAEFYHITINFYSHKHIRKYVNLTCTGKHLNLQVW